MKSSKIALIALSTLPAFALPIDWHGEFQVDTHRIEEFRNIEDATAGTPGDGSQEVNLAGGEKSNASFQTYILKLKPEIVINDSTTFKAELTTGYGHGGRLGESNQSKRKNSNTTGFTSALYNYDTVSDSSLNLTQAYAVFYADTATYTVGRQATNWGLGALHNNGEDMSTRHATIRDGITIDFKIGNFNISPYYAKISSRENLTKSARVKETGVKIFYNNLDTDFSFGLLYAKNRASNFAKLEDDSTGTVRDLGKTDVTVTDIYFKKGVGNFTTEVEIPLLSGDVGHMFNDTDAAKYKAKAFLVHNTYNFNSNHAIKFNLGKVSGDAGTKSSYEAMYLHPNFQIANILFRYNLGAVADKNQNVFDSYVSNVFYAKFAHVYNSGSWTWENSVIWARAEEVAKAGKSAYNHTNSKYFTANYDQKDDLGFEIDSNFKYQWNTAVTIGGNFGYFFTGDYFAYTNEAQENKTKNSYALKAFVNVKF
ncbi:hypothetical protein [Bacteriovorax sp. Seq25_V]|uniref:hypothetical protein n=1 Tax=Bacteriovorax sp. Seq25_V TaxID=1201288 RepID=UPI00038A35A8|nr:hypothetical protein [Bacteriovorax sp. Seq25_V]EQC43280.1 hypothetical protein M900_2796 [Bacteriovorax sp. Seq25_V]